MALGCRDSAEILVPTKLPRRAELIVVADRLAFFGMNQLAIPPKVKGAAFMVINHLHLPEFPDIGGVGADGISILAGEGPLAPIVLEGDRIGIGPDGQRVNAATTAINGDRGVASCFQLAVVHGVVLRPDLPTFIGLVVDVPAPDFEQLALTRDQKPALGPVLWYMHLDLGMVVSKARVVFAGH